MIQFVFESDSTGISEISNNFRIFLKSAMEMAQDNEMQEILICKFRKELTNYMREYPSCIRFRNSQNGREEGSQQDMLLFDKKYLYLSPELFRKLGDSFEKYCSLDELKRILAKEDILAGQNGGARNYWTVKLNDMDGKRYLRIRRSFVEMETGDLELTLEELYGEEE